MAKAQKVPKLLGCLHLKLVPSQILASERIKAGLKRSIVIVLSSPLTLMTNVLLSRLKTSNGPQYGIFREFFTASCRPCTCEDVSSSLKTKDAASPCLVSTKGRIWLKIDRSSRRKEDVSSGRFN